MIEIGCIVTGRDKILHNLTKSTANQDVIAKSAVYNFFATFPWFEKVHNYIHDTPYAKTKLCELIITRSLKVTLELVENVIKESDPRQTIMSSLKNEIDGNKDNDIHKNEKWQTPLHTKGNGHRLIEFDKATKE